MDLVPGTRLGIYEVHSLLGVGGMGEVYRARDTRLGRDVAIKILPRVFTSDPSRLGRFEREARVLASLNHPNIAGIHGVEESDDVRGLVLELVEGETLADRIARRPALPLAESMAIARQIADALDATHEKGITHRDLKPANVKITPDGVVKVLDFGLATPPADSVATDGSTATWHHTREGAVVGTAAYMSPEQARGQSVDKRTDVWAFGCVLYEMLAGRPAFRGPTISDTVVAILDREPAWDALPASTPPNIRRLLGRLLEKDQRRRLRDIGDALVEFDSARSDSGPSAGPDPVVSRSAWTSLWVPAAALVAIGLVVAGWWLRRPAESRPLPETRLE
ncbi:MAG TPA: serine/threonine-protein kinase, partial [Vicinamibacterales bacterium]